MEKKPFVKISFKNCNTDYDYTICPWSEVSDYIQMCEDHYTDATEGYEEPVVTLTTVFMTEDEYDEWFAKNVEADA